MKKRETSKGKKYRILELLKKLPHEEYRVAKKKLPILLEVSTRTFERWLYLPLDTKTEVSVGKLVILSKYLKLSSMEELINYEVKQTTTKNSKKADTKGTDLIKEFNLTK